MKDKPTYEELEILLQKKDHLLSFEKAKTDDGSLIKSVLNSSDSPIVSLDKNFCYTSFNSAHENEMRNIYGANIKLGGCIHNYITSEKDRQKSITNLNTVIAGNKLVETAFYGNEVRKCYEIVYSPIFDSANEISGLSVFLNDVTEKVQLEEEKNTLIDSLKNALNEIKVLEGVIPICSYCHKMRNDKGAWDKLESYISSRSGAQFSHGICPDCLPKVRKESGLDT